MTFIKKENLKLFVLISILSLFPLEAFSAKMRIKSPDIQNGRKFGQEQIFNDFGCEGENKSPTLEITNVPKEAKSLAITMHDPDAPTQSGWWHWIVFDIDPNIKNIPAGSQKISENARYGRNDYGAFSYGGPCPPEGENHRYNITLFALNVENLDVTSKDSTALISYKINAATIKKNTLSVSYHRKKK